MSIRGILAVAGMALVLQAPSAQSASFQWLGGSVLINGTVIISDDGTTVAFDEGSNAVRWTQSGGSVPYSFALQTRVAGLSADGSVMVGNAGVPPYRWDTTSGYQVLPLVDPVWTNSHAVTAVSGDGAVIVGYAAVGGACCLDTIHVDGTAAYLPGGNYHIPTHMTPSGRVIVGYNQLGGTSGAQVYTYNDALQVYELDYLRDEPGAGVATIDTPTAVSADGAVIVGGYLFNGSTNAWHFSRPAGFTAMDLGGYASASAKDLDAAGTRAAGWGLSSNVYTALLWDGLGSVPETVAGRLASLGVAVDGTLMQATGISADGTKIVGIGRRGSELSNQVFLADISPPPDADGDGVSDATDNCTLLANASQLDADGDGYGNICDADLNNSGLTTSTDFGLLRSVLNQTAGSSALSAAADMNGSGLVTSSDFNLLRARLNAAPGPSGLHP